MLVVVTDDSVRSWSCGWTKLMPRMHLVSRLLLHVPLAPTPSLCAQCLLLLREGAHYWVAPPPARQGGRPGLPPEPVLAGLARRARVGAQRRGCRTLTMLKGLCRGRVVCEPGHADGWGWGQAFFQGTTGVVVGSRSTTCTALPFGYSR